jgi:3-phenylpropionate/trans-cinnamate dioxygenase ferredoxin subunit
VPFPARETKETDVAVRTVMVSSAKDLEEGRARVFRVEDLRIALCRVGARIYAVEDLCTHDEGPLGEGRLDGFAIECPRHGARFDVRDGKVLRMPAAFPVRTFPTHEKDGQVYVEIDE